VSPAVAALGPLDLHVPAGTFVAIVGPSGCGKSTLLRLVADLESATHGTVAIGGEPPAAARRRREIGIVFQAPVLLEWRTVAGNVALPLEVAGAPPAVRDASTAATLALVGLADVAQRYPRQLSGGMQQRVALARALAAHPRLLLMDEPFGALDELTRERLNLELLDVWARTGTTVLFVTHSLEEAVFVADRVVVLSPRPGRMVADVPVALPRPRTNALRADAAFVHAVAQVRAVLAMPTA
jgi:NitT/TauT family transport system ATP-binding protein